MTELQHRMVSATSKLHQNNIKTTFWQNAPAVTKRRFINMVVILAPLANSFRSDPYAGPNRLKLLNQLNTAKRGWKLSDG